MTRSIAQKEIETDFATWVEDLLHSFGYFLAHFRPAKTDKGWRTAVSCDGAGFPDYIAVKPSRCIVAELKSEIGTVTPEQRRWLDLFAGVEVVETYLWRPSDREEIEQIVLLGHVPNLIESAEFKSSWLNRRKE